VHARGGLARVCTEGAVHVHIVHNRRLGRSIRTIRRSGRRGLGRTTVAGDVAVQLVSTARALVAALSEDTLDPDTADILARLAEVQWALKDATERIYCAVCEHIEAHGESDPLVEVYRLTSDLWDGELTETAEKYDQAVPQDVLDVSRDVPAGTAVPVPGGRDWDDSDLCLWREDGEWSLQGPDGVIEVEGFGCFGHIKARDVAGAKAAAAAAIEDLTGRTVTGWDPDASSRSIHGEFSWYPCTETR
jgi:hypothetical protein